MVATAGRAVLMATAARITAPTMMWARPTGSDMARMMARTMMLAKPMELDMVPTTVRIMMSEKRTASDTARMMAPTTMQVTTVVSMQAPNLVMMLEAPCNATLNEKAPPCGAFSWSFRPGAACRARWPRPGFPAGPCAP
ncbi:hypothetical protein D9M71_765550 [compost metagenome]